MLVKDNVNRKLFYGFEVHW